MHKPMDHFPHESQTVNRLQTISRFSTIVAIAISILVGLGWVFNIDAFKNLIPGATTMKMNTALGAIICGVGILSHRRYPRITGVAAIIVLAIGSLTLAQYIFSIDLGIDQLLIPDVSDTTIPGRMSVISCVSFILLGLSLWLMRGETGNIRISIFTLIILSLSTIVFLGYVYGVEELYGIFWFSSVALHTAIVYTLLCVGILLSRPQHGIVRIFTFDSMGGYISRSFIPIVILIPVAIGWLLWQGQKSGYYGAEFDIVLFTLSNIFILGIATLRIAYSLHAVDVARKGALEALNRSYTELEQRVRERTEDLTRANEVLQTEITQRTQAEEQFRVLLESAPEAMVVVNEHGEIVLVNTQAEICFGYARDEMIGHPIEMLIPVNLREKHARLHQDYGKNPRVREMGAGQDLFARRKDESLFPVEVSLSPVFINGNIMVFSSIRDITERKQYERVLRFNASLQQNVSDAVIATDLDFKILSWNPAAERIYGWSADEVMGRKTSEVLKTQFESEAERQRVVQKFIDQGFWQSEFTQYRRDGTEINILGSTTLFRDRSGNPLGVVSVNHDITDWKRVEREARRLQVALATIMEGAQIIGYDWRYIYVNDAAALQAQLPKESIIGQTVMETYPEIEHTPIFNVMKRCLDERVSEHLEVPFTLPDGSIGWFELSIQPIPEGIFILSADITKRKRLETELKDINSRLKLANEEVQQFAYIVSHDLRAPLINLKGFSEILRGAVENLNEMSDTVIPALNPQQAEVWQKATTDDIPTALKFITSSVDRMDQFTSSILKLSRLGHRQLNYETIDVTSLVKQILQSLNSQTTTQNIEIIVDDLPEVEADRMSLDQIFSNIIINAIKYMSPKRKGKIHIFGEKNDQQITYHIKDNGRGIAESHYDRVFAPFRRGVNDVPGEGMGLAYVQSLVKRHAGKITFTSVVNSGTTFSVTLPVRPENSDAIH